MKVLMVCNYRPGVGGISGQVELLQRHLRDEGNQVDVFNTKASLWKRLLMISRLCRVAKTYDVIHVHCCSQWGFFPAVVGITAGQKLGKRLVLTYHGGGGEKFFDRHRKFVHYYLTRTDANIVLSGFLAKVFEKYRLPYAIIPNIIEMDDKFYRERSELHPWFVCVRSHEELYNIPCILKAFKQVQARCPNARLTLVGDGTLHESLKQLAAQLKLENVTFTGRVPNSEIYHYLNNDDIMLSSPVVDNMPVSLLEAMNAGLLVISSRVGGVPYLVADHHDGLLFESDDETELAEKMLWALDHQEASVELAKQGHRSAAQYLWRNVRVKIYATYGVHS